MAILEIERGRVAKGEEALRAVLDRMSQGEGLTEHRLWGYVALAEACLARGDAEAAEEEARRALAEADRSERPASVPATRVMGMALECKQPGSGRELLEKALSEARDMGMRIEEGRALVALADGADGDDLLHEARAIFQACGAKPDLDRVEAALRARGDRRVGLAQRVGG